MGLLVRDERAVGLSVEVTTREDVRGLGARGSRSKQEGWGVIG